MIENTIRLVPTAELNIGREARFRTELDRAHVRKLAKQIQDHGLIHAILIEMDTGKLIAGENRLAAFDYLHTIEAPCPFPSYGEWTKIPARRAKEVSELDRRTMELSENIGNCPMQWQDIAAGILELHRLMQSEDDDITQVEVSRRLGVSSADISNYLLLARNLHLDEIRECSSKITALNILRRKQERTLDSLIDSVGLSHSAPSTEEQDELPIGEPAEPGHPAREPIPPREPRQPASPFQGQVGNFLEWAPAYQGPRFNLIHFDPPYGINLHKSSTMKKSGRAQYEDTEDLFHAITDTLLLEQDRIISSSAHILFWHSAADREAVISKLRDAGWRVWPYPLIWHKSDNTGLFPDSNRGPRHTYEMATLASRGDRKIVRLVSDSIGHPATKTSGHESEKPTGMLEHFFTMLVDGSTSILDPTGGSGNALRAARNKGAASGLFLELEPHYPNAFNAEMKKEIKDA